MSVVKTEFPNTGYENLFKELTQMGWHCDVSLAHFVYNTLMEIIRYSKALDLICTTSWPKV